MRWNHVVAVGLATLSMPVAGWAAYMEASIDTSLEYDDNVVLRGDGVELPRRSGRGAIGFQRHGGEAYREKRIEFRAVRIREL